MLLKFACSEVVNPVRGLAGALGQFATGTPVIEPVHACGRSSIVSVGGTESLSTESDYRCDESTGCDMGLELPFLSGCSVLTTVSMGGREPKLRSQRCYTYRVAVGGTSPKGRQCDDTCDRQAHPAMIFQANPGESV